MQTVCARALSTEGISLRIFFLSMCTAIFALGLAQSAGATFAHTPYTGPQFDFTLIEETTQAPLFGGPDVEPLWESVTGVGNTLEFSSTIFDAVGSGGTFDDTHSTLEVHISALDAGVQPLDFIRVEESGTLDISGAGTAASGAILLMGGTLTLTTILGEETFTWGDAGSDVGAATFDAGAAISGGVFFDLVNDFGVTNWTGSIVFDTAALLATRGVFDVATDAVLQYNDQIQAYSEAGSTVEVKKTDVLITPEPATGVLLVGGLIALGAHARRRRASCAVEHVSSSEAL